MFSIYISAFNLIKNSFPYLKNLYLACKFADEVIVVVNKSVDETLDLIKSYCNKYNNLKIIETNFDYNDIKFDGACKNMALQATTQKVKIQLDLDEYIPLSQKNKWLEYADKLLNTNYECLMIPSIDLFGNKDYIRSDQNIGIKFRMHKIGLKRGVWKYAWIDNKINTSKSDSCELLNSNDDLVNSIHIVPQRLLNPIFSFELNNHIFTIHEGYLDFKYRVNINKNFWKEKWEQRSGHPENVITEIEALKMYPTIKHNLIIE